MGRHPSYVYSQPLDMIKINDSTFWVEMKKTKKVAE